MTIGIAWALVGIINLNLGKAKNPLTETSIKISRVFTKKGNKLLVVMSRTE